MDDLFQNDRMFRVLVDNLGEGVYFTDTRRRIRYWNKGAESITGFLAGEVMGRSCAHNILVHTDLDGCSMCQGACPLAETMQDQGPRTHKLFLRHKQGHRVPVMTVTSPIVDDAGSVIGGLETFHDVTTEMAALSQVEELRAQALLCPLTGVGNRRYADQMLAAKFEEMSRNDSSLGIALLDIDHFKSVNDTYGHNVGDIVLKMVARTLANAMRTYDFLARWGGEEFIAIMPNIQQAQLVGLAERLRVLVEKSSATVSRGALLVTVSVGATEAQPGSSVAEVLARADALMYASKQAGRNRVSIG